MTRYWVGVASKDHVLKGVEEQFCQLCRGKVAPLHRLHPGDRIIYYSPKERMRAGAPIQSFTAIGIIKDGEPYKCDMGGGFVPYRRDVNFFDAVDAPIRPLLQQLSFTKGRPSWGSAFRFGLFEISKEDYALIAQTMGVVE
jgi:hypothetical protein